MTTRRTFIASFPIALGLVAAGGLPQVAWADISGLIQDMKDVCAGVETMSWQLISDTVTAEEMDATLEATADSDESVYNAQQNLNKGSLDDSELEALEAASQAYLDCLRKFIAFEEKFLKKMADLANQTPGVINPRGDGRLAKIAHLEEIQRLIDDLRKR